MVTVLTRIRLYWHPLPDEVNNGRPKRSGYLPGSPAARAEGDVIDKDTMLGVLLDACPSFVLTWEAFFDEWREESDDLPLYLALAKLARHLCGMLARDETATFPRVFAAVERLLVEGDGYVREAACVGLVEDLQNANLHAGTKPEQFRPFLGPETARCWSELDLF